MKKILKEFEEIGYTMESEEGVVHLTHSKEPFLIVINLNDISYYKAMIVDNWGSQGMRLSLSEPEKELVEKLLKEYKDVEEKWLKEIVPKFNDKRYYYYSNEKGLHCFYNHCFIKITIWKNKNFEKSVQGDRAVPTTYKELQLILEFIERMEESEMFQ